MTGTDSLRVGIILPGGFLTMVSVPFVLSAQLLAGQVIFGDLSEKIWHKRVDTPERIFFKYRQY